MEEYIIDTLRDFIGENWGEFENYCVVRGENLAEEIYEALGGEPEE